MKLYRVELCEWSYCGDLREGTDVFFILATTEYQAERKAKNMIRDYDFGSDTKINNIGEVGGLFLE